MARQYRLIQSPDQSVPSAGSVDACVFEQRVDGQLVHRLLLLLLTLPLLVSWVVHVDEKPLHLGLLALLDEPLVCRFVDAG